MLEERIVSAQNQFQSIQPIGPNTVSTINLFGGASGNMLAPVVEGPFANNTADPRQNLVETSLVSLLRQEPDTATTTGTESPVADDGFADLLRTCAQRRNAARADRGTTYTITYGSGSVDIEAQSRDDDLHPIEDVEQVQSMCDIATEILFEPRMTLEEMAGPLLEIEIHAPDSQIVAPYTPSPGKKSKYSYDKTLRGFGIEKTFMSLVEDQHLTRVENKQDKKMYDIIDKMHDVRRHRLVYNIGMDPGCIEISSAVMHSIGEAHDFFHLVSEEPLKAGLAHYSPAVCGTGGHIHVSKPEDIKGQVALWNFTKLNPWINAFGHPMDDMNLKSPAFILVTRMLTAQRVNEGLNESNTSRQRKSYYGAAANGEKSLMKLAAYMDVLQSVTNGKFGHDVYDQETNDNYWIGEVLDFMTPHKPVYRGGMTITPREYMSTFEFRCFDAVHNWAEQKAHIDFAQAVYRYTQEHKNKLVKRQPCVTEMIEMFFLPYEQQAEFFKSMIEKLELDWNVYKRYLKNLKSRIKMEHELQLATMDSYDGVF